jgi:hypothetical protein
MLIPTWMLGLAFVVQVPPPAGMEGGAAALRAERRAILDRESAQLGALADRLAREGKGDQAEAARGRIEPPPPPDGSIRFVPLPELVPARGKALANVPVEGKGAAGDRGDVRAIRAATTRALFDLAGRAASPGESRSLALADECLRGVLDREPDHPEARRLLGFVPFEGGWGTPHAVQMLKQKMVLDPTFGWVEASWVEHLARGELPGRVDARGRPTQWLPADRADALRADWDHAWTIKTAPHFEIRTNAPLAEAIAFGRRLEMLHDLFFSIFADVIGPRNLPLALRFEKKPVPAARKHQVWYFAAKAEYVEFFRRLNIDQSISLGYYMPAGEARRLRLPSRSYFFRDRQGQIDSDATLYHEGSHQLLFESAGPTAFEQNAGNYWVWEGLGSYFETLTPRPDGTLRLGGPVGPRFAQARKLIIEEGQYVPIGRLVGLGATRFNDNQEVYQHYAESMALVLFLMNGEGGRYRHDFLDYVEDAYRGRLGRGRPGRSLEDRLGVPYKTLDAQFLAFLKAGEKPEGGR